MPRDQWMTTVSVRVMVSVFEAVTAIGPGPDAGPAKPAVTPFVACAPVANVTLASAPMAMATTLRTLVPLDDLGWCMSRT